MRAIALGLAVIASSCVFACRRSTERIAATEETAAPKKPPAPHVVQMSIGLLHACARLSDGTIRCFGSGSDGALGDSTARGARVTKPPIDRATWVAVDSEGFGRMTTCAVVDGVARCFGWSEALSPAAASLDCGLDRCSPSPFLWQKAPTGIVELALVVRDSTEGFSYARRDDGTVLRFPTWGERPGEEIAGSARSRGLAVGVDHACIVTPSSTVRCLGQNFSGQLGDGTFEDRAELVDVPGVHDVTGVCAGAVHTCALGSDGAISCWGDDGLGELGYAASALCYAPFDDTIPATKDQPCSAEAHRSTSIADAVEIACGTSTTCARRRDGSVACWGWPLAGTWKGDPKAAHVVPGIERAIGVAVGQETACAFFGSGPIRCWGRRLMFDGLTPDEVDETPAAVVLP